MFRMLLALTVLAIAPSTALAQQAACPPIDEALKNRIQEIQATYQGLIAAKQREIEGNAQRLKEDAPKTDGAVGTIKVDVKWTDKQIILDLPATKLTDKKIIVDLPSVTMKEQKWSFDVPVVRMEPRKVGQYPEEVCEPKTGGPPFYLPGIECITRWHDIITNVPVTYTERKDVILGVPEFTMVRQEFVVGVPEFFMNRQTFVLRLPDITVSDIQVEADKYRHRAEDFTASSRGEMEGVSKRMQADIESATIEQTNGYFDCQRKQLITQRDAALGQLDAALAALRAGLATASGSGATQAVADLQAKVTTLLAQRDTVIQNFAKALSDMDATQKSIFKPKGVVASAGNQSPPFPYRYVVVIPPPGE